MCPTLTSLGTVELSQQQSSWLWCSEGREWAMIKERKPRILLVAATTGYQTRMFGDAVRRHGAELVFATDRCHQLDDPWSDDAIAIRFNDEAGSVRAIVDATGDMPIQGVVAVGDRPAVIGALAADAIGVPGHPPAAARVASNKLMTRQCFAKAGLPGPWFKLVAPSVSMKEVVHQVTYPCVVKPLALAASRGVIRANTPMELESACDRLRRLLQDTDIRALGDSANEAVLIEEYVPGSEYALEGLVTNGEFSALAVFEKPEPLEGPFFEESIYVTPPRRTASDVARLVKQVAIAVEALGLTQGPVHAECRLTDEQVVVLEVAARPIGGLCSKVLRFTAPDGTLTLEDLLVRHALSQPVVDHRLVSGAAAVMMIPVPSAGVFKSVAGVDAARRQPLIEDVIVTAKQDQCFVPWPEGASYPGFIFARGDEPSKVIDAVHTAHRELEFEMDTIIPIGLANPLSA